MAKKSKPSKKPKAKPSKTRFSAKRVEKKGPRSQALPGMEQVRDTVLDRLCESIGEGREAMNKLRTEEKSDTQGALRRMHDRDITAYRHAGVELVRVPGEEKLRVRTTGATASDMTEDLTAGVVDDGAGDSAGEAAEE